MKDIKEFPKILIGKPLKKIGRCANLTWFIFGIEENFSLHVQCSWRLIKNNILIASNDIYVPKDLEYSDDFDWNSIGSTLFDSKVEELNAEENQIVKWIEINSLGDIQIIFEDIIFQSFIYNSCEEEQWRFFRKGDRHMVVRPNGIEWE